MKSPPKSALGTRPRRPFSRHRLASLWVVAVLLTFTLANIRLVARYGTDLPFFDEWSEVPYLTGHEPVTPSWIWQRHNEHRVPVPRLLYLALHRISGGDFRSPMFFSVFLFAALAAGSALVARKLRGHSATEDAAFPLVLLHWGHSLNFLTGFQLYLTFSSFVLAAVFLLLQAQRRAFSVASAIAVGSLVTLLPLSGATGLAMAPPMALWMGYVGVQHLRSPQGNRLAVGRVLTLAAAATSLLIGLYFVDFTGFAPHARLEVNATQSFLRFFEVISMALGPAGRELWPLIAGVVTGLLVATAALLVSTLRHRHLERFRATGSLAVSISIVALVVAIAWGRRHLPAGSGFAPRYSLLTAPLVSWVYLVWLRYGPQTPGRLLRIGLLLLLLAALPQNTLIGRSRAVHHRAVLGAAEEDIRSGMPAAEVAARYRDRLYPRQLELQQRLAMLERAGKGPYQRGPWSDPRQAVRGDSPADGPGIGVYLNRGGRRWIPKASEMSSLVVGDFDGDGYDDLAGLDFGGGIHLTSDLRSWRRIQGGLRQLASGDWNGDGRDDLAGVAGGKVFATTDLATWTQLPGPMRSLVGADLDGDGRDDLAAISADGRVVYATDLEHWTATTAVMNALAVGDFDGDGRDDLAALDPSGTIFSTTNLADWSRVRGAFEQLASGDLDGDGRDDLIGLSSAGEIYFTTDFVLWRQIPGRLTELVTVDLDADGRDDIVGVTAGGKARVSYDRRRLEALDGPRALLVTGDFDGDGRPDLAGLE